MTVLIGRIIFSSMFEYAEEMKSGKKKPGAGTKQLFLIDGIGAMLTSIMLFLVLPEFGEYFHMPSNTLRLFSALAGVLAIYSLSCYYFINANPPLFLRLIGIANLVYCILTVTFLVKYYDSLTTLDFFYFTLEIIIISGLASVELISSKQNNKQEESGE